MATVNSTERTSGERRRIEDILGDPLWLTVREACAVPTKPQ